MLLLLFTIFVSTIMTCIFRYTEPKGYNGDNIMTVNYFVCVIVSLISALRDGSLKLLPEVVNTDFSVLFTEKTIPNSVFFALAFGFVMGFLYIQLLVCSRLSYIPNGTSITIMFEKVMFIVPIIFAFFAWGEVPAVVQVVGIVLALVAIVINATGKGESKIGNIGILLACVIGAGFNQLNSKLVVELTINEKVKSLYVLTIFVIATIFDIMYLRYKNKQENKKFHITFAEIIYGIFAGIPNVGYSFLLLQCLGSLPGTVVYPSVNAGNLMLITIISRLFFKEKITSRQYFALALTFVGLVLVNL